MGLVSILKFILSLASSIAGIIRDKGLLEAGEMQQTLKSIREADEAINRANNARATYDKLPPESDPNNRDNAK
jgi:hypothetical protein